MLITELQSKSMKRPYEVQFIHTHESLRWVMLEDAWSVRTDFRWKWMGRLARWIIRKIGVNARDPVVDVQRILIDPPDIMQKILAQHGAMFNMGREPKRLLIGADDFADLMRHQAARDYFTFDAEYSRSGRDGRRVCGLQIEVIPWMRGCLVMP